MKNSVQWWWKWNFLVPFLTTSLSAPIDCLPSPWHVEALVCPKRILRRHLVNNFRVFTWLRFHALFDLSINFLAHGDRKCCHRSDLVFFSVRCFALSFCEICIRQILQPFPVCRHPNMWTKVQEWPASLTDQNWLPFIETVIQMCPMSGWLRPTLRQVRKPARTFFQSDWNWNLFSIFLFVDYGRNSSWSFKIVESGKDC